MLEVRIDPKHVTRLIDIDMTRYVLSDDCRDYMNEQFGCDSWSYTVRGDASDPNHWIIIDECELFRAGSLKFNDKFGYKVD